MGVFLFVKTLIPPELELAVHKLIPLLFSYFSPYCYCEITESDGVNTNELYPAVQLYLSSIASPATLNRLSLTRGLNSSTFTFGLAENASLSDVFNGVSVVWKHNVESRQSESNFWSSSPKEKRRFTLRINKRDKRFIIKDYLDFISRKADEIKRNNKDRLLCTNSRDCCESVPFIHPSTFDTLAMDPAERTNIMSDLLEFTGGQALYKRTGREWKRGYLLYGPPGTGKSSMIAAIANLLDYDIYDLDLSVVKSNSELRKLLMKTTRKSIIVIEDIDCSINITNRKKPTVSKQRTGGPTDGDLDSESNEGSSSVTLSGLLNFTDGIWSCCGSERIFVFTTNHIENLDPALLRSGRMDNRILMSYCSFPALKILLKNYLECDADAGDIVPEVLEGLEAEIDGAEMTPADIAEVLTKNRGDNSRALTELLVAMKGRSETKKSGESSVPAVGG
ncbi:hypothetical protein R6Q57_018968 [Mikania cordata]